jgi:excisionase family DNA binding protein
LKAGKAQVDNGTATARTLRSVLEATGDTANVEKLYRLLSAQEAAHFLGLAEQTVRDMTYRHELPYTKIGIRGVRYRLIDLILWSEERSHPAQER